MDHESNASPPADVWATIKKILKPLASLQLTVVLFALSMVLVFFGTVAMMSQGLWTIVDEYFRSAIVWIPFDLVRKFGTVFFDLPKDGSPWSGSLPFPGGWTIGAVMLVNLTAAHLTRFKLTWKRSGMIILHLGIMLLMIGELVTGLYAVESTMSLKIGEKSDFLDVTREFEIAVIDPSDPKTDHVTVIPQRFFKTPGNVISHPDLPFDLEVVEYWPNTGRLDPTPTKPEGEQVFQLDGLWYKFFEKPEGAGVDTEAHSDAPSAVLRAKDKQTGADLGTHFVSLWFYPNYERNKRLFPFADRTISVDGKPYWLMLRNKRVFLDYSVELLKFEHGVYPGTTIPKDFASTVIVRDDSGDEREVRIWMNNPLRYHGHSLYQHATFPGDTGTVLQVVENPGRILPYASCIMVTVGMLIHFGIRLLTFVNKPKRATA